MATDTPDPDEKQETWVVPGVNVTERGYITIPADTRDRGDIEEGDVVDLFIAPTDPDEDWQTAAYDEIVRGDGEVVIRDHKRDIYGIEPGDVLYVEVRKTGLTAPD